MRVDHRCRVVDSFRIDFRSHEARAVAESSGIKLRSELPQQSVAFQALDALDDFFFRHVDRLSDESERRRDQGNLTLQGTQQLTVPLIDFLHLDPRLRWWRWELGIDESYEIGRCITSVQTVESENHPERAA